MRASVYSCGDFQIDLRNRRFIHLGQEIGLEPRVFAVIAQLLTQAGSLVTREELLDAVWGHRYVTPSALNRTIALARKAFRDNSDEPRFIQTVHGAGYRYIGAIADTTGAQVEGLARFEPPPSARLPARVDALIGRESHLEALTRLLNVNRAVTVLGAGGMGKTRLALEAARRAADRFPDGVWFFDLVPFQDITELESALSTAFAARGSSTDSLLTKLASLLRERRLLLVFDNCERIAPGLGTLVVGLLRSTQELRVLATSQAPLNFSGEQLVRLPPLACPRLADIDRASAETLMQFSAIELMVKRARAVRPEFELDPATASVVAQICVRLDGMPLALELAAARFLLLSASQILERLEQRFRFLDSHAAGREERHRNLQSLLDWSYSLLSAEEQRVLNWMAVFVEPWTVDTAIDVGEFAGRSAEATIDLLEGLVNHSLVSVVAEASPPRHRLLESVREYAQMQLRNSGEEVRAQDAHSRAVEHSCQVAHAAMLAGDMQAQVDKLVQERGDIAVALQSTVRLDSERDRALGILGSLLLYSKAHGDYTRVAAWCRSVLPHCAEMNSANRARALLTYGVIQTHLAAATTGQTTVLPEAACIAAAHGDTWTEAYANGYYSLFLANESRVEEATAAAERCESYAKRHDDALLRGLAGLARGWIGFARNDLAGAITALLPARELGPDLHQRHFVSTYIGLARFGLGQLAAAAQDWLEGLSYATSVGNTRGMAASIEGCGYIACQHREFAVAAELLAAARAVRERTGMAIFKFWRTHQLKTLELLHSGSTAADLEAVTSRSRACRTEDAVNTTQSLLRRYAQNRPVGS